MTAHEKIVRLLLRSGADPWIRCEGEHGRMTPLALAVQEEKTRCENLLAAAMKEAHRPRVLYKARCLLEAGPTIDKARTEAREKRGLRTRTELAREASLAVPYLQKRVEEGQELPRPEANAGDEELVGTAKLAVGMEVEGAKGLPQELFVELLEYLVPAWDPARRGRLQGQCFVAAGSGFEDESTQGRIYL